MMMMIDSKNVVVFRLSSWWSSHVEQIMAPSPKIIISTKLRKELYHASSGKKSFIESPCFIVF
jgi:hypothetical protein